jgi:hypothetical protein
VFEAFRTIARLVYAPLPKKFFHDEKVVYEENFTNYIPSTLVASTLCGNGDIPHSIDFIVDLPRT